jgi:uncharacterized protein YuzE
MDDTLIKKFYLYYHENDDFLHIYRSGVQVDDFQIAPDIFIGVDGNHRIISIDIQNVSKHLPDKVITKNVHADAIVSLSLTLSSGIFDKPLAIDIV